jgi:hypothetical protein
VLDQRVDERDLPGLVEMRVRLVEHDQARLAVERASQCNALALPAREHCAAVADLRLVAVGQLQDHFVRVRETRGTDDPLRHFGTGHRIEARNVLADCP